MRSVYEALRLTARLVIQDIDTAMRGPAYAGDVTYTSNNELAFDCFRDRLDAAAGPERILLARTTYQRFLQRYDGISEMTGAAREVTGELWRPYRLRVATIWTHLAAAQRGKTGSGQVLPAGRLQAWGWRARFGPPHRIRERQR